VEEHVVRGSQVNKNIGGLKSSMIFLNDSVDAGLCRSSFLQRLWGKEKRHLQHKGLSRVDEAGERHVLGFVENPQ
jgi:hypothetical protein